MADTSVAITAGSGTAIDTRTEATNGNHRQVIVIGDPATNAGVAPVDATKGLAVDLTASGALPTVTAVTTVSTVTNVATIGTSVTPGTSAAHLGKAEDAAHSSGDTGVMLLAVRTATAPTDKSAGNTDGDYEPLQVDANGRLYVNAALYTAAGAAISQDTQATQDTALGTITSVTGALPLLRASAAAPTGVSADDDAVLPWALRNGSQVVNAAVGGTLVAANAGLPVTISPQTTDGLSTFMASGSDGSSILVATAQAIKASAGMLYGYFAYNPEAAVSFVHFYNTAAASVTVGTTNPLFTIQIPAGAAANLMFPIGVTFSNAGWSCAATTTAGGNTAPSTGVSLVAWYK